MAHSEYVVSIIDKIIVACPIFANDNKTIVGSILIYKTEVKSEAEKLLKGDPYYSADIWDKISTNTFRGAIGDVVGGKAFIKKWHPFYYKRNAKELDSILS